MERVAIDLPMTPALEWLARLSSESGYLGGLLAQAESEAAYEAYVAFMEEVRVLGTENPAATATDMLYRLSVIDLHELPLKRARTRRNGVNIMTAHHAKGMEFPGGLLRVAITTDERSIRRSATSSPYLIDREEDGTDIRRLFYVALTRAKTHLFITYAKADEEGRTQTPLRFMADIAAHLEDMPIAAAAPEPAPYAAHHPRPRVPHRAIMRTRLPTGFDNYLASPWRYLFRTLLQIPDAPTRSMQFGTAIHAGLKRYVDLRAQGDATNEKAVAAFRYELSRLPALGAGPAHRAL